jgi:PAS domain S-box-containing protein
VDAIIATDLEGHVTFVNKGVEAMFGYEKEDILKTSLTRYYAGGKKQGRKHRDTILKKGQLESVEMDFLAKDGRTVRTLASLSLLREKGEVTGIMGVFKDVSKQKRLQKTLESLNKAAVSIQKSRTMEEIFAVTGEELRQFDFHVTFILFNLDRTAGKIVYSTVEVDKSLKNEFLSGYELSLDNSLFRTLLKNQEATYIDDIRSSVQEVLPPALSTVYDTETEYSDINKKAIMAPLIIQGEVTGLLVVLSDVITQEDIPSIRAFANQVSTALENARLLQESQGRADKIAANLEEQHLLRELNTRLFVARSLDEVLDAAIQGIHNLGKSFSNIKLLNKERTNAHIVRFEMEPGVLKTLRKIGEIGRIGYYQVFIGDEDSIYHQFFNNQIPLVTPNISVGSRPVITADLSELYRDIVPKGSGFHRFIASLNQLLSYKSVMMFPLIIDGTTGGSLTVTSKDIFTGEDFELMGTIAEMVSSAVQRVRHGERLTETLNELRAVQRINTLLNMGASINSVLDQICLNIMEVYHYEFAIPLLLDPSRRYLMFNHMVLPSRLAKKMASILGVNPVDFTYPIAEDVSLFKTVIVEKKCLIRKGLKEMADRIPFARFSSVLRRAIPYLSRGLHMDIDNLYFMLAPLPSGEEVMGVLFLGHKNPLTESDFQLLKHFLDQVGVAIAKSEIENRLRQSFKELQELDRMKSEFIDIASHELRTPLTILQLYLEMIAMEHYGELPEKLRERVSIMQGSVNRLEEIIDQTLVASRLIKNKLELEGEQISLVEIATDVVRQLQPLWNAKNQQIFVEDVDLSPVEGDRKALSTVMSNVVDNAIRYSPKDTDILIGFEEHTHEVECTIQDQGYGIPPEYKEKVFDEFYIVPSETEYARMDGRTGLGLFIAKGIVERHNGRIWVESTPSRGSVFHFTVPKKR